jgi:hypothetical protein
MLPCALFLACLGCAAPALTTRPVHTEPSWFVRLDSYADPRQSADQRYDHPAEWTEAELRAILERLLVQERRGLLDPSRPPRAVFSAGEISRLAPQLAEAFRSARSTEWVAFYLVTPVGSDGEATSGAFFVTGGRLHVVIANYRERITDGPEAKEAIRANPLRSLKGTKGSLTFDPSRFVLASQAHWSGGPAPAGSELILDDRAFLDSLRQPTVLPPSSPPASARPPATRVEPPPPAAEASTAPDEMELLKRKAQELEAELVRLKQRLHELEAQRPGQADKPSLR